MKYDRIKELIEFFEEFEEVHGMHDMGAFSAWLYDKFHTHEVSEKMLADSPLDANGILAMNIGILFQHAKHYIKTALKDTELKGIFDYTFLATLYQEGDLKKSDLIQRNTAEFSPGMEVIKRLLRHGFIEDYVDSTDKRSRKVRITEKGKAQYLQASLQIKKVNIIVGGNFDPQQKIGAALGTVQLADFHRKIWEEDFGTDLDEIIEKYINQEPGS